MEPAHRTSVTKSATAAEPRTPKRALSPRRKDCVQSVGTKRRVTHVSPRHAQFRVGAAEAATRKPKARKNSCPYDPVSETVMAALFQVLKDERNAARDFLINQLGMTWEFDFAITPQQLLIRVLAPSKTLAELDNHRPPWLIQTSPDSHPTPLGK